MLARTSSRELAEWNAYFRLVEEAEAAEREKDGER